MNLLISILSRLIMLTQIRKVIKFQVLILVTIQQLKHTLMFTGQKLVKDWTKEIHHIILDAVHIWTILINLKLSSLEFPEMNPVFR
jgi:hypothetical protein